VRLALIVAVVGLALIGTAPSSRAAEERGEQAVTPIPNAAEQRVEGLTPSAEQRVEVFDARALEQVAGDTHGPVRSAADKATKLLVGVLAAGLSLGAMAAQLLFF